MEGKIMNCVNYNFEARRVGKKETDNEERVLIMNMLEKVVDQVSNLENIMEGKVKLMNVRIERKMSQ